jgi:hypothetical protein
VRDGEVEPVCRDRGVADELDGREGHEAEVAAHTEGGGPYGAGEEERELCAAVEEFVEDDHDVACVDEVNEVGPEVGEGRRG